MDAQIRGKIKNNKLSIKTLDFYKLNFSNLIKNKLENIAQLKKDFGI